MSGPKSDLEVLVECGFSSAYAKRLVSDRNLRDQARQVYGAMAEICRMAGDVAGEIPRGDCRTSNMEIVSRRMPQITKCFNKLDHAN